MQDRQCRNPSCCEFFDQLSDHITVKMRDSDGRAGENRHYCPSCSQEIKENIFAVDEGILA